MELTSSIGETSWDRFVDSRTTNIVAFAFAVLGGLIGAYIFVLHATTDPAADVHARSIALRRFHVVLDAPLVLDCRIKPWLPPLVEPAPETVARVDARWAKLLPGL